MIALTEDKLIRHELIGLEVNVIHSSNPFQEGISGIVLNETKNMLVISSFSKERYISKDGVTYKFTNPDGAFVEIEGRALLGRSIDRIGKTPRRKKY
ncbi:ribonuclease P protein subunit [Candidatus Bathyarchaeota archaeon]|nr:ribonuclease P protein subunit [Candidatus Bathyarchaeota archaeon]